MAQGDLYEVALGSRLFNQDCANIFHFVQTAPVAGSLAVPEALIISFLNRRVIGMRAMSLPDVLYTSVRARNLFDATEDVTNSVSLPGTSAGGGADNSTLPSFNSYGFSLNTESGLVKAGSKRLVGVPEQATVDGVVTDAGYLGQGVTVANSFAADMPSPPGSASNAFRPVVIKRVRSGTPNNYEYRLPENLAEAVFSRIISALFHVFVTTQLSRKIGIGS